MTIEPGRTGPLSGTKVVAVEHSVAGPLCSRILADLGASVIKIERPPSGDFSRHWDNHVGGESAQFWWLNQNKRGLALDLGKSHARKALECLLEESDVLVQNLSPPAADRLGLNSPDFEKRFSRLIHCHISGYGNDGSSRERKAYDMLVQAESGMMSLTGDTDAPVRIGVSVCDVSAGIYAALLVLAALHEQRESGQGRRLDVAMFDVATEYVAPSIMSYSNKGVVYPRLPDKHHAISPYGVFRCRDSKHIVLAVEQEKEWRMFCNKVLREPHLATDPRFSSNLNRVRNREHLEDKIRSIFSRLTLLEATEMLEEHGFAYAVVNSMEDLVNHPVIKERGIVETLEDTDGVISGYVGLAARVFSVPDAGLARPPKLGEASEDIIRNLPLSLHEQEELLADIQAQLHP